MKNEWNMETLFAYLSEPLSDLRLCSQVLVSSLVRQIRFTEYSIHDYASKYKVKLIHNKLKHPASTAVQ